MMFADLFAKMKLSQKDAEVIFDRDEPVGQSTDLVLPRPRRRWFRRVRKGESKGAAQRSHNHFSQS